MTSRPRVRFVVAVWGDRYVATLLDLALPSFLAPGNIPACAAMTDVQFRIYTRPEDVQRIAGSDIYRELQGHVAAEILPILTPESLQGRNRYEAMALCHHEEIAATVVEGAVISVLSPDCLVADGSLSRGLAHVLNGHKAVLVAGPRGILDSIGPQILNERESDRGPLLISSRRLVGLGVRNLHPISRILYWDAPELSNFPSALYWRAGSESVLMKYFHLHPLFVNLAGAPAAAVTQCGSVDGALISAAGIRPSEIHFETNSDEIAVLELSSLDHDPMGSYPVPTERRSLKMLNWAAKYADITHRSQFLAHEFRFNGEEEVDWTAVSRQARADLRYVTPGLRLLQQVSRVRNVLRTRLAGPRQAVRSLRAAYDTRGRRLAIELIPPLLLKALHRLKSARMATFCPTNPGQAVRLTKAEFDALVSRMDRGDFDFDHDTRERLIALWKQDNGAVPYPTAFNTIYQSDDALAMNRQDLMEVTYRLPYSLAYENTQKPAYGELVDLAVAHGVTLEHSLVADVGCGFGGLLASVHERAPGARLFGIECAESALAWMREHRTYITPVLADLTLSPEQFGAVLGRPMDVVFCTAVLEHLEDPQRGLANLLALAPRGTVVVAVPNGRVDTAAQHINFWSPESWRQFISRTAPDREIAILRARNSLAPGGFENAAILKARTQ